MPSFPAISVPRIVSAALRMLERMGTTVIDQALRGVDIVGTALCLLLAAVHLRNWNAVSRNDIARQIYYGGVGAIAFVALISLMIGLGMVYQIFYWLSIIGESDIAYPLIQMVLVREVVPLLVALVFAGRSGMAILAEMGGLQQGGQVRALERVGVDSFEFLLLPRFIGGYISILCLTILMLVLSILTGLTFSNLMGTTDRSAGDLFGGVLAGVSWRDLMVFFIKPLAFSLAIVSICGGRGLVHATSEVDIARQLPAAFTECVIAIFVLSGLFVFIR